MSRLQTKFAFNVYAGDDDVSINSNVTSPVSMFGLGGNDILNGGSGNDTIDGGDGDDQIHGGDGDDSLDGGSENDLISGGDGGDYVFGGAGNDDLEGNNGDDRIEGGLGDDTVAGGTWFTAPTVSGVKQADGNGNDTFVYGGNASLGYDSLIEGSNTSDTFDFSALDYGIGIDADLQRNYVRVENAGKSLTVNFVGSYPVENVIGTIYNDRFVATKPIAGSTFTGGLGDDTYHFNRGGLADGHFVYGGHDTIVELPGQGNDILDYSLLTCRFPVLLLICYRTIQRSP